MQELIVVTLWFFYIDNGPSVVSFYVMLNCSWKYCSLSWLQW